MASSSLARAFADAHCVRRFPRCRVAGTIEDDELMALLDDLGLLEVRAQCLYQPSASGKGSENCKLPRSSSGFQPWKGDAEKGAAPATRDAGIGRRPGTASGLFGLSAIEKDPRRCVVNSSASVRSSLWCHAGRQALVNRLGLSCVCSSGQHILGLEFGLQA